MWGCIYLFIYFKFLMQLPHQPSSSSNRARTWPPKAGAEDVDGWLVPGLSVVVLL